MHPQHNFPHEFHRPIWNDNGPGGKLQKSLAENVQEGKCQFWKPNEDYHHHRCQICGHISEEEVDRDCPGYREYTEQELQMRLHFGKLQPTRHSLADKKSPLTNPPIQKK